MQYLLKLSTQTVAVLAFGAIISATLTYYIPKTQNNAGGLHGVVNDNGGVAFFSPNKVKNEPQLAATSTNDVTASSNNLHINVAPPHDLSQKFVKVSELGAFMKEARIVRKAFKMADLKAATGLTEEQILKIENGLTMPTPDIANELESVLKVEVKFR
jgi:Helix-turn-helix